MNRFPDFDQGIRKTLSDTVAPSDYGSDCFVTSEVAYNEVVQRCLPASGALAGAYLGIGPDQNFIYAGALKPKLALVVDARVDNLLEHLMFKLMFERAADPLAYLCLLFSREAAGPRVVAEESGEQLVKAFDRQLTITSVSKDALVELDKIPDLREVICATSSQGFGYHYLTSAERYGNVKQLQALDRIVPVLGNITTAETMARVSKLLDAEKLQLNAVYISNMEEFLLKRYVLEDTGVISRPNPAGMLEGEPGAAYGRLVGSLRELNAHPDCLLLRFFFPGEYRGWKLGVFPWLEPNVQFMHAYLERFAAGRAPKSVFDTYL
jgi:hypothetical protein